MRTAYPPRRLVKALAPVLLGATCTAGCTARLYEGGPRAAGDVATIHAGNAVVRAIDGQGRRGGAFDAESFELPPGPHEVTLVFELPARSIGIKSLPAQSGVGTCVLAFDAAAGRQYFLGARARGELSARWDGSWEGWVRDPSVNAEDDVVARCEGVSADTLAAGRTRDRQTPAPSASPAAAPAAPPAAAPPAAAAPAAAPQPPLRLGTWNLRSFGRLPGKDLPRIAAAIDAHFDLVALTELSGDGGPNALQRLLIELGATWAGLLGPAPHPPADRAASEYTAILYRRDRLRPCDGWERLRELPSADGAALLRAPAVGCFAAGDATRPGIDLLVAAYHATSADGDAGLVAAETAALDGVFTAMALARPGEDELIIAGDFNLESVELASVLAAPEPSDGAGATLDLLGNRTARRTDHLLFRDARATAGLLGVAEVIDLRGDAPGRYYSSVSDHLPIVIQLRVPDTDDD